MRRGQSALEYLVTYGWAILAIVIVAGVLWYTGVFDPSRFAGGKQCAGFSPFICQDFKVNTTGGAIIVFNNGEGGQITGVNVTSGISSLCSPTTVGSSQNPPCNVIGVNTGGTAGNTYDRATVSGSYTDSRSGISHTFSGTVQGRFE